MYIARSDAAQQWIRKRRLIIVQQMLALAPNREITYCTQLISSHQRYLAPRTDVSTYGCTLEEQILDANGGHGHGLGANLRQLGNPSASSAWRNQCL